MGSAEWLKTRFSLAGRTALVTGGGSGVGYAMAEALGRAGARLMLAGRSEAKLAVAAMRLAERGVRADSVATDLTQAAGIVNCASAAEKALGRVDILVNAAGFNLRVPFSEVTSATWEQHIAIHLSAPFFLTQRLAPAMRAQCWGRIVNVASLQSSRAFPNGAPYGAAKGGVVQLTRAIAEEWSPHGITCNAIAPGFFPSALTAPVLDDPRQAALQASRTMIGRNGEPTDLHGVTVFFASDASAYITGQLLYVDGGYSAK
jgi:gluconate 5-dehydrogenase